MYMFKVLKGHIEYQAKHLQPAKCIDKEEKVVRSIYVPGKIRTWGTLVVLALLQILANKLYKAYREKIFNTS